MNEMLIIKQTAQTLRNTNLLWLLTGGEVKQKNHTRKEKYVKL